MCWHKQVKLHKKLLFNLMYLIIFNVFNFIICINVFLKKNIIRIIFQISNSILFLIFVNGYYDSILLILIFHNVSILISY